VKQNEGKKESGRTYKTKKKRKRKRKSIHLGLVWEFDDCGRAYPLLPTILNRKGRTFDRGMVQGQSRKRALSLRSAWSEEGQRGSCSTWIPHPQSYFTPEREENRENWERG